jgi:hypothetical protein
LSKVLQVILDWTLARRLGRKSIETGIGITELVRMYVWHGLMHHERALKLANAGKDGDNNEIVSFDPVLLEREDD